MPRKRQLAVYALLAACWLAFAVWQAAEHRNSQAVARDALLRYAKDTTRAAASVIFSQRFFFNMVRPERLEAALKRLAEDPEIRAIGIYDINGKKIAAVGEPLDIDLQDVPEGEPVAKGDSILVSQIEDLGQNEPPPPPKTSASGPAGESWRGRGRHDHEEGPDSHPERRRRPPWLENEPGMRGGRSPSTGPAGGRSWGGPRWLTEERRRELVRMEGPHHFVLLLRGDKIREMVSRDLWLRVSLGAIALLAALGLGTAWWTAGRSLSLELRLARAQEMNAVLREMNVAAAGLAHETRNPLNVVRGMAQTVARESAATAEIREKAEGIIEEVDRVSSRLGEFLNFSKPREAKPQPADLKALILEVRRALESDIEEKRIDFALEGPTSTVEADPVLVRQALFNLLLNAIQAVEPGGKVRAAIMLKAPREIWLEIRDTGPGVPPELREDVFRPYFTTKQQGTGLGLAVVRQIVLAHRWEIECLPGPEGQWMFRIKGIRLC